MVKVLCYKSEGRWFDSRWFQSNFSLTYSFRSHYGPGVDSASNRNKYQEHFLGVKAVGAYSWQPYHHPVPLSSNRGTLTLWNPLGHSRPVTGLLYLHSLTSVLHEGVWSMSRPDRLPPGKETRYPLYRLGGPHGRSGRLRNISPPPGFDPRTVQPVASRYTHFSPDTSLPYILHFPDAYAQ